MISSGEVIDPLVVPPWRMTLNAFQIAIENFTIR
jgi:hypothetical protein